ncbi:autotransporter domain-containing protein [Methylobacterium haplocladii]|uniref:autotransporter domain-containing protein n=1 Tax=Methylobacterium haplocladii TaxID=1176176 RepID=UPI00235BA331|nr:autotransporter domain-containing protein [Methylobacterium haplocladii]GLS58202.1 outer membrane autotransporter barrel domain-containing protein [Methylobacterium haplocladii]
MRRSGKARPFRKAGLVAVSTVLALASRPARSQAVDLSTFAYFPQRTAPASAADPYGFALDRPSLPPGTPQPTLFEFNANWGSLAVGQAAALNTNATRAGLPVNGLTGLGVTVAVIDSGIDAQFRTTNPADGFSSIHPEFVSRLDTRSRAFLAETGQSLDILDRDGHGTHVAGTIGANRNGVGMMGIAPDANIVALKAIGAKGEPAFDSEAALAYAASLPDVRIVNGSYGPTIAAGTTVWQTGDLTSEYAAVRAALTAGKILVFANGNDFASAPVVSRNPTGIALYPFIRPANAGLGVYNDGGRNFDFSSLATLPGSIIAVANVDASLKISGDSNRCGVTANWCVSAPGGGTDDGAAAILSAYPRAVAGTNVGPSAQETYRAITGTSMATPHVSGVLAVLFQAFPAYSSLDIVRVLLSTTQDLGVPGIDDIYGRGLVRLDRALSAPAIDPAASANTANLAPGETRYWSAPVTAAGTLTVTGAGREQGTGSELVVAGRTTLRGTVRAESVDIEVDGTLTTPQLSIAQNASLSGEGDIFGNVEVKGLFSPGSGNGGDLVVHGNLTLAETSLFHALIDASDAEDGVVDYSIAMVTGQGHAFRAAGALVFDIFGITGTNRIGEIGAKFPLVLATDGASVLGRFISVSVTSDTGRTGLPAASRIDLLYRPNSIVGAITPAAYASLEANGVALSARQRAVGAALDRARGQPGDAMSDRALGVFDPLFGQSAADLPRVFEQLSGAGSSANAQASVEDSRRFTGLIGGRLDALRSGTASVQGDFAPSLATASTGTGGLFVKPPAFVPTNRTALGVSPSRVADPAETRSGTGIWGLGFGNGYRIGADSSGPGLRAQGGGLMLGADRAIDPSLLVGAAFGYARSSTTASGTRGTSDTYLGAAYLGYQRDGVEVDAIAGLAYATLDSLRAVAPFGGVMTARGRTDGFGAIASVEAGYRFLVPTEAGLLGIKPLAGVAYNDLHRSGFAETGAGGFGLSFAGQNFGRATTFAGVSTGLDLVTAGGLALRPDLRLGWTHDLIDASPFITTALLGQPFRTRDARPGRDGLLVDARVTLWSYQSVSLFAGYRGEYRPNAASHQGHAGLRVSW